MITPIFVDPEVTDEVIRVNGRCYHRVGASAHSPNVSSGEVQAEYDDCNTCTTPDCCTNGDCSFDLANARLVGSVSIEINWYAVTPGVGEPVQTLIFYIDFDVPFDGPPETCGRYILNNTLGFTYTLAELLAAGFASITAMLGGTDVSASLGDSPPAFGFRFESTSFEFIYNGSGQWTVAFSVVPYDGSADPYRNGTGYQLQGRTGSSVIDIAGDCGGFTLTPYHDEDALSISVVDSSIVMTVINNEGCHE